MSLEDRTDLVYSKNRGLGLMDISFFINVQRFVACHANRVPFLKRGQYKRNETQSIWIIGEYYVINHPDKAYRACRGSIRRHLKKVLVQRLLPDPRLRRTCTIIFSYKPLML